MLSLLLIIPCVLGLCVTRGSFEGSEGPREVSVEPQPGSVSLSLPLDHSIPLYFPFEVLYSEGLEGAC